MFIDRTGFSGERIFVVVFAGINTNKGTFDHVTPEFAKQLWEKYPDAAAINYKTIYPYDDSISGDTFDDVKQVVANAYELSDSTVSTMADEVKNAFEAVGGADFLHFVGYSGGGVAASRVAEKLSDDGWGAYVSSIVRIGSPNLTINLNYWGDRTTDVADFNDLLPAINIPRAVGWSSGFEITKYIWGLNNKWYDPMDVHTSYFRTNAYDKNGVSNLTKTVSKAISYFK